MANPFVNPLQNPFGTIRQALAQKRPMNAVGQNPQMPNNGAMNVLQQNGVVQMRRNGMNADGTKMNPLLIKRGGQP